MRRLRHRLAHLCDWHTGYPVSWYDQDGRIIRGFECGTFHEISHIHRSMT